MAALRLDPRRGLRVRWRRKLSSLDFSALVGPPRRAEIVIPDLTSRGDTVAVLDERTGRLLARSRPLADASAPGNIVTPGFGGRFYYLSGSGRLCGALDRAEKNGLRIFDSWLKTGARTGRTVAADSRRRRLSCHETYRPGGRCAARTAVACASRGARR